MPVTALDTPTCGEPHPLDPDHVCPLPAGHPGGHDGASDLIWIVDR